MVESEAVLSRTTGLCLTVTWRGRFLAGARRRLTIVGPGTLHGSSLRTIFTTPQRTAHRPSRQANVLLD